MTVPWVSAQGECCQRPDSCPRDQVPAYGTSYANGTTARGTMRESCQLEGARIGMLSGIQASWRSCPAAFGRERECLSLAFCERALVRCEARSLAVVRCEARSLAVVRCEARSLAVAGVFGPLRVSAHSLQNGSTRDQMMKAVCSNAWDELPCLLRWSEIADLFDRGRRRPDAEVHAALARIGSDGFALYRVYVGTPHKGDRSS